jgi:hypothetical protein
MAHVMAKAKTALLHDIGRCVADAERLGCKGIASKLRNIKHSLKTLNFRLCERKDCGEMFPAERKGKRYCKWYCAHLVSVRAGRKISRAAGSRPAQL